MNKTACPIVDVSDLVSHKVDEDVYLDPTVQAVSKKIIDGFTEFGFIYITGHGIHEDIIDNAFKVSKDFFTKEEAIKKEFLRMKSDNWGYVPFRVETFDKSRPFDLKECFNFYPTASRVDGFNKVAPEFMQAEGMLFEKCKELTYMLLKAINLSLPVTDMDYLLKAHDIGNFKNNPSITRLLYYPPIESKENILDCQLRCGEHSDYGTITLLFQDNAGGLQIVSPSGEYVDVTPIPGAIVVNAADLLDIWTSGKLRSTRHRVVIPTDIKKPRQSIAFFVSPNNDLTISNLDNSGKNEPINALDYLLGRYGETY